MYKIFFHEKVKEDLKEIPKSHLLAIKKAIDERLGMRPYDFRALSGDKYKGLYRLRLSDFRIIYRIDENFRKVTVLAIGHRRLVYKDLDNVILRS